MILFPLAWISLALQERKRLQDTLRELDFVKEVKETDANFFLMQVPHFVEKAVRESVWIEGTVLT